MELVVGDVVRDHSDQALGTVAGVASPPLGTSVLVVFELPGGTMRLAAPEALDLVARHIRPTTAVRRVSDLLTFVFAGVAAYIGVNSVQLHGGSVLLSFAAGLGCCTAVWQMRDWTIRAVSPRPRRFRV